MNCDVHRGDGAQPVYHMNNWLGGPAGLSDPLRAEEGRFHRRTGHGVLGSTRQRPTFVAVDWWEDGDVGAVRRSTSWTRQPFDAVQVQINANRRP